ncbi:MAG: hypothetical protein ABIR18_07680 [Chitinophagaceae bacterium]
MQLIYNAGRIINTRMIQVQKGTNIFRYDDPATLVRGVYILSLGDEKTVRYRTQFLHR